MAYRKVRLRTKVVEGLKGVWYEKLCALSFFRSRPLERATNSCEIRGKPQYARPEVPIIESPQVI